MTTTTSETEPHPWRHTWQFRNDVVTKRRGKQILRVRREHRCDYCPTKLFLIIDVKFWRVAGRRYKYDPTVKIVRVAKSKWLERQFFQTTNLDPETIEQIKESINA